jgi:hypothetical protein
MRKEKEKVFKELNPPGAYVGYHGRDVIIQAYTLDGDAIVLDTATDEETVIPIEELYEQNY